MTDQILYRAPRISPALIAGIPAGGCLAPVALGLGTIAVLGDRDLLPAAGLSLLLLGVVLGVLLVFGRPLFEVSTQGVRIRNAGMARSILWSSILRVDVERTRRSTRGQVVLHLVDGTMLRSAATGPGLALFRGDGMAARDLEASVPYRAAVEAHRAWLASHPAPVR